jgi:uncharacterized protein YcbK (DUF882 family)
MGKTEDEILKLVRRYDKVRTEHTAIGKEKDELSVQIKALIGDRTQVPVRGYRVSYAYDKDKTVTTFDEETFAEKEPKKYAAYQQALKEIEKLRKKYVKTETVSGSRRLLIDTLEEE